MTLNREGVLRTITIRYGGIRETTAIDATGVVVARFGSGGIAEGDGKPQVTLRQKISDAMFGVPAVEVCEVLPHRRLGRVLARVTSPSPSAGFPLQDLAPELRPLVFRQTLDPMSVAQIKNGYQNPLEGIWELWWGNHLIARDWYVIKHGRDSVSSTIDVYRDDVSLCLLIALFQARQSLDGHWRSN